LRISVCDRFGDVFCEVSGDLAAGNTGISAFADVGASNDLDIELFSEADYRDAWTAGLQAPA